MINVVKRDGTIEPLNIDKITKELFSACEDLNVSLIDIKEGAHIQFFEGIKTSQIQQSLIQSAAGLIDIDKPDYEYAAARLLLNQTIKNTNHIIYEGSKIEDENYPKLSHYLISGILHKKLSADLLKFDVEKLEENLVYCRDYQFKYFGLKNIVDRYLIRDANNEIIELPQHFWMRVAMGMALNESVETRTDWAIKFYDVLSRFEFISSTPTLFNSGTPHSQMSSCFVQTVHDSIYEQQEGVSFGKGIFPSITESALYSKFAGGIGADWTRVRAAGGEIKGTNGESSGIVPYLKVFNDTAVGVNQSGRRNGSFAAYIEPWHGDVERFIDLKKPTGDERIRAREIFPYLFINDLFMERVRSKGKWSLFCSHKNPELCETHGTLFEELYVGAEERGDAIKVIDANELWKSIITALVESGAPMITFKDEFNRRNPQTHDGIIRSSNLCSEVGLNTNDVESAVCNLGSINLAVCSPEDFARVIPIAMRMLDNVIDLNFYPTEKAKRSNLKHRPVGLGLMGWTDYIVGKGIDWESNAHLKITDSVFELFSYWAILSSVWLAKEKGCYSSYEGSTWSRGILPIDSARPLSSDWLSECAVDWDAVRNALRVHGMRNSNCMAIAPTATISLIVGTTPCIEPTFRRVFVEENKSGKFKVIDPSLRHGRPELCKEVFEIDQEWIIKAAAVRQRYIDQSQSVNLYKSFGTKGSVISGWYFLAWELGLKSTYYLRQETTEQADKRGTSEAIMCSIDSLEECESCQ